MVRSAIREEAVVALTMARRGLSEEADHIYALAVDDGLTEEAITLSTAAQSSCQKWPNNALDQSSAYQEAAGHGRPSEREDYLVSYEQIFSPESLDLLWANIQTYLAEYVRHLQGEQGAKSTLLFLPYGEGRECKFDSAKVRDSCEMTRSWASAMPRLGEYAKCGLSGWETDRRLARLAEVADLGREHDKEEEGEQGQPLRTEEWKRKAREEEEERERRRRLEVGSNYAYTKFIHGGLLKKVMSMNLLSYKSEILRATHTYLLHPFLEQGQAAELLARDSCV
ncbi:hypothetical protein AK812_SmicGene3267 [Symbiodinium microadriaticum]|uniref:Uncharacterized protein n=1 Tax=Symbiodinium microadriaticum TaxID=2951 RepID=A0A1Q9EZ97_SYMMI|nr:hypothetical protein AK812_SmicGene3267 [Symbiodinium microadriaticum]